MTLRADGLRAVVLLEVFFVMATSFASDITTLP
jgi:hypothetical protein